MAYRTRYTRRTYQDSGNPRTKFVLTLAVVGGLFFATIFWILPAFINGVGLVTGIFKTSPKAKQVTDEIVLAPPTFTIPFEETNTSPVEITGFATPNSKVQLFMDGRLREEISTNSDGTFIFRDVELALGTNNIYGKTLDDRNKESLPSRTIKLVYDNERPELEITEPEDGRNVQGVRELDVSGKTEQEAKVFINGSQIIVKSDGTFSSQISLNDGENLINIRSLDKAGNDNQVDRRVTFQP